MVYSARRFVFRKGKRKVQGVSKSQVLPCVILFLCVFFFSPFSIAITSQGKENTNLSASRTSVRFALVWFCLFPLPLGVWEGLRLVIVALPGLFSYLF